MKKIAHISDLHISYNDENGNGKKLVELLKDIEKRNCDHIFITGDLAENPDMKDLTYVREILSHFNLLDSDRLSIVPGNHDIFGGAPGDGRGFFFPHICSKTDYEKNVDSFIDVFKETFPSNNSFPYFKIINNIAIAGVNSIDRWSESRNPEGSNGLVTDEDKEKLSEFFKSEEAKDKYKIVLIHHHFYKEELREDLPVHSLWLKTIRWKMKMRNRKKLTEFLKKMKVNLILHGHTHISEVYIVKGITVVNSSGCSLPFTDDMVRKYFIINIPEEGDETENVKIDTVII